MYAITTTVTRETHDGWTSTRQVPTFYLDENVQGIVDEAHAQRIAIDVIDPWNTGQAIVTAVKINDALKTTHARELAVKLRRSAAGHSRYVSQEPYDLYGQAADVIEQLLGDDDEDEDFCARCVKLEAECECYGAGDAIHSE